MAPRPAGKRPDHPPPEGRPDVCLPHEGKRPLWPRTSTVSDVGRPCVWPDRAVGDLAARQYGVITRTQLKALGLTRAAIDNALQRGRIRGLHRGVYSVGDLALPAFAPEMAAVLAVGDGAYLSHRSAAALWGMVPRRPATVEVTLLGRDAGRRRAGIEVHQTASIDPRDVTIYRGIPVTRPPRVLLDIAPGLSNRQLERMFDRALKERRLTRHEWQPPWLATPARRQPPACRRWPPRRADSPR